MKPTTKNVLYMLKESNAIESVHGRYALVQSHRAWKYLMTVGYMTPEAIKQTHDIVMKGLPLEPRHRGAWRDVPVWIGGVKKDQPPLVIDQQVKDWCDRVNESDRSEDPVKLHIEFENIHPFVDGNGRVGRLLLNWQLVKINKASLIVYTYNNRHDYYALFGARRENWNDVIKHFHYFGDV